MSNISFSADLLSLEGSALIKGKAGQNCIIIDVDRAKLQLFTRKSGKAGCNLNQLAIGSEETDQYGNDYMVVRNLTKNESEANKGKDKADRIKGEILGNGRLLVNTNNTQAPEPTANADDVTDDIPF